MNITQQISEHIVAVDFDQVPQEAIDRAKVRLIDSLGVIAAGAYAPGCDAMLSILKRMGGTKEASIFTHGIKVPTSNAALMNSLMMRSYDFEAIEAEGENKTSSAAHISGTTVPVALAVSEYKEVSGKDFLTALIAGDDLAARLGSASGFDVYSGWDNTGTQNTLGATAIAGKLLGLDAVQLNNAFGIAENQLGGVIDNINDKTMAFKLPMALASRNAVFSAELAQKGFTAMQDAIGSDHGFFKVFCSNPNPETLTKNLGTAYYADVVIKPYAACRATHPSITACEVLRENHAIDPSTIQKVTVRVTPRTYGGFVGQPFEPGDTPQISGAFSIRFAVANMLLRGQVRPEDYALEKMQEAALQDLLSKIELEPSLAPDEYLTAEVQLVLKDGTEFSHRADVPKGDINKNPITWDQILEKYYANLAFSGSFDRKQAEKVVDIAQNLEQVKNLRELIEAFS